MRFFFAAIFAMALVTSAAAAGWSDNGDGTWTCSPVTMDPVTVSDLWKQRLDQCRASDNFRFRRASDALEASAWLDSLKAGIVDTRHNNAVFFHRGVPSPDSGDVEWYRNLWAAFLDRYVWKQHPDRNARGLQIVIDAPVP